MINSKYAQSFSKNDIKHLGTDYWKGYGTQCVRNYDSVAVVRTWVFSWSSTLNSVNENLQVNESEFFGHGQQSGS